MHRRGKQISELVILSAVCLAVFLIYLSARQNEGASVRAFAKSRTNNPQTHAAGTGSRTGITPAATPGTTKNTETPEQGAVTGSLTDSLAGSIRLKVPFVSQWPELPTGCEIAAAAMLLQYYGFPADKYDMAWNYLEINSYFYYDEFGVYNGPDPNDFFIGDPESFGGYGCFAPVIVRSLNRYLQDRKSSLATYDMTGCLFSDLIAWLKQGSPVLVWASGYMTDLFVSDSWMLPGGELFTWPGNEHCLVLAGYDENGLWFNDPLMDYEAYGILQYSAEAFAAYWQFLGRQTILIR